MKTQINKGEKIENIQQQCGDNTIESGENLYD
jgi:hypothetical protein